MSLYADEIQRIKSLLNQMDRGSKKSLGQNFLVNSQKISHIVDEAQRAKPESVVEVGPGLGALTLHLKDAFPNIILLELDDQFAQYWSEQGLRVEHGDALQMDWGKLNLKKGLLVSNLPYQISARLVVERSIDPVGLETMVLMFQKEVAQRITARHPSPDYSLITVIAQTFWDVSNFAELGPNDFYPPPKVASRVVVFKRKNADYLPNPQKFLSFIKLSFSQRRKFLKKSLLSMVSANKLEDVFAKLKLPLTVRPEEVTVAQFQQMFLEFSKD